MNEMTCREFDEVVHRIVRMELLDVNLREAALEHTVRCRDCAERMAEATALAEATETVGRTMRDEQAPARVEAAVLAGFRSHHRRAAWRRTFEWATVGAAAAVLVLFAWTFSGRSKGPLHSAPGGDVTSKTQGPLDAKVAASPARDVQDELTADVQLADASDSEASEGDAYVPSDFVPVPFTDGIAPDDPGMVVRVQLTRASLLQLGYPTAETPDEDLILADVLVGEDGWPRAVKVLQ
jgi:hypothetical protein